MLKKKLIALLLAVVLCIPAMTSFGATATTAPSSNLATLISKYQGTVNNIYSKGQNLGPYTDVTWQAYAAVVTAVNTFLSTGDSTDRAEALTLYNDLRTAEANLAVGGEPGTTTTTTTPVGPDTAYLYGTTPNGQYDGASGEGTNYTALPVNVQLDMHLNPASVTGATGINWYYVNVNKYMMSNPRATLDTVRYLSVADLIANSDGGAVNIDNTAFMSSNATIPNDSNSYVPQSDQIGLVKVFWAQFVNASGTVVAYSSRIAVVVTGIGFPVSQTTSLRRNG